MHDSATHRALVLRELQGRPHVKRLMVARARARLALAESEQRRRMAFIVPNEKGRWIVRSCQQRVDAAAARLADLEGS